MAVGNEDAVAVLVAGWGIAAHLNVAKYGRASESGGLAVRGETSRPSTMISLIGKDRVVRGGEAVPRVLSRSSICRRIDTTVLA